MLPRLSLVHSPCPALSPAPGWVPAAAVSPSTPQPGGMQEEPTHGPIKSPFSSLTSSWNLFYRRVYTYTCGSCYFPFPIVFSGLSYELRAAQGEQCWQLCQVFLMVREGLLDLEKPQFLGFGCQEGSVITPHPLPGCWTPCASREPTTVPSPGVLLATGHTLPISVLL